MAQGKQELQFERNPCIRFRDKCDTDGRMTTSDGQRTKSHIINSAETVKQS